MLSFKNLLLLALPASIVLSSCSSDEDPQPQPQPQPTTPEPVYSAPAVELDHIKTPTTLEDRNSDPTVIDYYANKNITVSAEFIIKPGVVIGFEQDARLDINGGGIIKAEGTAGKKIKFIGKTQQKGFWAGVMIYSNSSANSFNHLEILHAGSKPLLDGNKEAVALFEHARLSVTNTLISQSGGFGIYFRFNSLIVNFAANKFSNNQEAPLLLSANHVSKLDEATIYSDNNGRNVVEMQGSSLNGNSEEVWPAFADGTPIRILGTFGVRTGWKLKPGTTIEMAEDKQINIESNGYLNAIGTAAKPIIITGQIKATGSWTGIAVYTGSTMNQLNNVKLQYGGGNAILGGVKAAIAQFGTSATNLTVRNSEISNSGGYGIHLYYDKAVINPDVETSNTFLNNVLGKVYYQL